MKKFIYLFLFLLVSFVANSQTLRPASTPSPNSPTGYSLLGWSRADSGFIWGKRDTFPARFPTVIWHPNGNFYKTNGSGAAWTIFAASSAGTVSSVSGNAPLSVINGTSTPVISVDTSFDGLTTKKWLYKSIDSLGFLKLNIADTAAMLLTRLNVSDTAFMLSSYLRKSDTLSMLSGYARKTVNINTNAPLFGGGDLSANRTISADTGRATNQLVTGGSLTAVKDTLLSVIASSGGGTVLNVSTTNNFGINSSVATPTSTPNITIGIDTFAVSTRTWRNKGVDSAISVIPLRITDSLANVNRIKAGGSGGVVFQTNSGNTSFSYGAGGSQEVTFNGFAGYNANRSSTYTDRSFVDKRYADSSLALRLLVGDTLAMLSNYRRKTTLIENSDLRNSTISGISLGSNLATLTFGQYLQVGASSYNGSAATTITTNATSTNAGSTLVARDINGDFAARNISATLLGNASSASTVSVTNDIATNATFYPMISSAVSGNISPNVSSTKLSFNPSTGNLTATNFTGNLSGNATTASALQTARTINGVAFDGSANITISASVDSSLSAGYGITGSPFNGSLGRTWIIDTANISTKANVTGSLVGYTTTAQNALKLNISDTAAMLSGYKTYFPRTAISAGSGIAYDPATGVISNTNPSLGTVTSVATNNGTGITGGTITSSGTLAIDTVLISTRAWRQKGVDSLNTLINAKLNISDTATMLANRLKISDTTSMLSPYRRTSTKIQNSDLANSTISGVPLGSNLGSLTAGNGLTGTTYNGNTGQTWVVDTSIISTKNNVTGALVAKLNISDTAAMLANRLKISDTATMLSPYARTANLPSLAPYLLKADSLSGGYTTWNLTKKKIDSLGAIKVNYTDTSGIVANYLRKSDTATMLNSYTRVQRFTDSLVAVQARIQTKQPLGNYLTFADSTTILAGRWLPNRSADSIAVIRALANSKGVGNVTSVSTTNGVGISSSVADQTTTPNITIAVDTFQISTRLWRQKGIDSVQNNLTNGLAIKLNISDTASMLANRLKISDTANMLSPYLRSVNAAGTYKAIADTFFNGGYTTRARLKQYGDSLSAAYISADALKKNIADTFFTTGYTTRGRTKQLSDSLAAVKFGGTVTTSTIPLASGANTLTNSAIVQTASGNRLLINGAVDNGSDNLQLSGGALISNGFKVPAGNSIFGISNARTDFSRGGSTPNFQIEGLGANSAFSLTRNSPDVNPARFVFGKSRGNATGSATTVQNGDFLGLIEFQGANGTNMNVSSRIASIVTGSVSADTTPSRLGFFTTLSNGTLTERMSILPNGRILAGTSLPTDDGLNGLQVNAGARFVGGVTGSRGRFTSLVVNKDSIPITTSNFWALQVDTSGTPYTNRVNRRDISAVHTGTIAFDTASRTLTINQISGGTTSVVIPRGTASGTSGITALSSTRSGNLVTVSGDNGSSTIFSVRDADSSSPIQTLTASYGISGSPFNGTSPLTWLVDTAQISTKANVTGSLVAKLNISDTSGMLSNYNRKSDTLTMLLPYLRKSDTLTMLSNYNRKSDTSNMLSPYLRKSDTATMLLPFVQYSDTANQMSGYLRQNFALLLQDTSTAFSNYLRKSDTLTMLANRLKISDTANMLSPYRRTSTLIQQSEVAGLSTSLGLKLNISDTSAMLANRLKISDTLTMLSPYARTANLPSLAPYILKADSLSGGYTTWALTKKKVDSLGAIKLNYTDTASMLSNYYRTSTATGALALKLNISDTAAMLANRLKNSDTLTMLSKYLRKTDTASMLSPYTRVQRFTDSLSAVQGRIQTKLAIADTSAMLSGYTRVKRFSDSLTAVQARIQTKQPLGAYITLADSSTILAGRWLPNRSADSIAVIRALANTKLNISDTAGMLSNRLRISDTLTMLSRYLRKSDTLTMLVPYLRKTDTSAMLSPYYRTATATAALATKLNISDTATMLTPFIQYSDTTGLLSNVVRTFGTQTIDGSKTLSSTLTANGGISTRRTNVTSLYTNKDSIPITTSNFWVATIDTSGTPSTNRVNRRNIASVHTGALAFDTTSRALTVTLIDGSTTSVVIPRGTASGTSGITSFTTSKTGNLVTLFGDNGSSTVFSIRDADSSSTMRFSDTAAMLVPYLRKSDTSSMLSGYVRLQRFSDSLSAVQGRIQTKLNISDTTSMLSNYRKTSTLIQQSEVNGLATSLAAKLNISDTSTMLLPYLRKTDTLSMLSPYRRTTTKITNSDLTNSTISGISLGNSLNNLSFGNGMTGAASYNGSASTSIRVDTLVISTKANVTGGLVAKLNISDTSSMLSNYARTSSLGSYAYRSSGLAELSGATFTGNILLSGASGDRNLNIQSITSGDAILDLTASGVNSGRISFKRATNEFNINSNGSALTFTGASTFSDNVSLSGSAGDRTLNIQTNTSGNPKITLTAAGVDVGSISYNRSTSELILANGSATSAIKIATTGAATFSSSVTASSLIKSGGTSSQFLKADGSVDGNTYITSASITGKLNISDTSSMLSNYRRTTTKITNSDLANSTISGIALGSTLNNLSAGSGLVGTAYNGSTAQTFRVDTGRVSTQIVTGGSLNKVRDSLVNLISAVATGASYTPDITGVTNVSGTPALIYATYTKVGNIVTVFVNCSVTATTEGNTALSITLPFTPTTGTFTVTGSADDSGGTYSVAYSAATSSTVTVKFPANGGGGKNLGITFNYLAN